MILFLVLICVSVTSLCPPFLKFGVARFQKRGGARARRQNAQPFLVKLPNFPFSAISRFPDGKCENPQTKIDRFRQHLLNFDKRYRRKRSKKNWAQAAVELLAPFLIAGVELLLVLASALSCRVGLSRRSPIDRQKQARGYPFIQPLITFIPCRYAFSF